MSDPWAVHDTRSAPESPRIGVPTSSYDPSAKKASVEVRWNDGRFEEVKLSRTFRVFRLDSLDALMLLTEKPLPDQAKDFAPIFVRVLAGPGKSSMRPPDIIKAVEAQTKLPLAEVQKAWKLSQAALDAMPEVQKDASGKTAKYRLVIPLAPIPIPEKAPPPASVTAVAGKLAESRPGKRDLVKKDAPAATPQVTSGNPAKVDKPVEEPKTDETDDGMEYHTDPEVAAEPDSDPDPGAKPDGPLARARDLETSGIPLPADETPGTSAVDIGAALATRKARPLDAETLAQWLVTDAPAETLRRAIAEVAEVRSDRDRHAAALTQFSTLLGRLLKHAEARIPAVVLAEAFLALSRSTNRSERDRGSEALDRLSANMDKPRELFSQVSLPDMQAAVRALPLTPDGPRARFLTALAQRSSPIASEKGWWKGFGWKDMQAVATGPLHALILSSPELQDMIRAASDEFASGVDTRRSLGELISAPRFAVEHLEPARLAEIMSLVAKNDRVFSQWHSAVAREDEFERVNERLENLQGSTELSAAVDAARSTELNELREHLAEAQAQVDALQEHVGGLTDRERRQMLLDAAKAIAQVAATVDGDGANLEHSELVRKINLLAERHGVTIDVARGEIVPFDSTHHSAPGSRPEPGESVNVARTGYTWDDGDTAIVVLPALVTRVGIDETRS
jgi:hypothetical protein